MGSKRHNHGQEKQPRLTGTYEAKYFDAHSHEHLVRRTLNKSYFELIITIECLEYPCNMQVVDFILARKSIIPIKKAA